MVPATYYGVCVNYEDILMLVRGCEQGVLDYILPTSIGGRWYEQSIASGEVFVMLTSRSDAHQWKPAAKGWDIIESGPVFESCSFFCKFNKHPMSGMIRRVSRPFDLKDGMRRATVVSYYRLRDYETYFLTRPVHDPTLFYTFRDYKPYVGYLCNGPLFNPSDVSLLSNAARDAYYAREVADAAPELGHPVYGSSTNQEYHQYRTDLSDVVKPAPATLTFPPLVVPDREFAPEMADPPQLRAPSLKRLRDPWSTSQREARKPRKSRSTTPGKSSATTPASSLSRSPQYKP